MEAERKQIQVATRQVKAQEDRITDIYNNEAMVLERYIVEMDELGRRHQELGQTDANLDARAKSHEENRKALEQLDRFCRRVVDGLDPLTLEKRQPADSGAGGAPQGQLLTRRQGERRN